MMNERPSGFSWRIGSAAILGFLVGIFLTLACAQRASEYLSIQVRHEQALNEDEKGRRAYIANDLADAEYHFRALTDLTKANNTSGLGKGVAPQQSFFFPFTGVVLGELSSRIQPATLAAREAEGHAKLGWVLERTGKSDAAQHEYEIAASLMGYSSTEKGRTLGQELLR